MKTKAFLAMVCVLFLAVPCVMAQNAGESKQDILFSGPELDFFCKYMLNREFVMPADAEKIQRLDKGKVEIEFDRKTRIANLSVTPGGFAFNNLFTIKQTNYDLDADGKRILPGREVNRTVVVKWSFGRSRSSGKMVGSREILYNDFAENRIGMTRNMILWLEGDDKMVILEIPGGYNDYFAAGGGHVAKTASTRTEIVVKDGKILRTSVSEDFDVDTETLQMTPTGEKSTIIDFAELEEVKK